MDGASNGPRAGAGGTSADKSTSSTTTGASDDVTDSAIDSATGSARVIQLHTPGARRRSPSAREQGAAEAAVVQLRQSGRSDEPATSSALPTTPWQSWEQRASTGLDFLRRRLLGAYSVDEYGFDAHLTDSVLLPLIKPLYDRWFRVEVNGVANIPADGGALLVANHAGGLWALDSVMTAIAVHDEHPAHRHLRMLGADLIFATPGLGSLARKAGATLACAPDAERLLSSGELVGVWPEGFKGIGKPFRERYTLQRFGRGGFVQTALRTGVPIVPVSVVGAEEIHPVLGNAKTLARVLNLPYFPITPTFPWLGPLGLVPLPSKWYIEFGTPIETAGIGAAKADDPDAVFDLTDQVRETIQSTLYRLLGQRRSVWR